MIITEIRCKECNNIISISDPPMSGRTGYYCQGCGEDKQPYEVYEDTREHYSWA